MEQPFCPSWRRFEGFLLVDEKGRLVVFFLSLIHTNKIVTTAAPNIAQIRQKGANCASNADIQTFWPLDRLRKPA
ncbi:MAG TPA: hypothetical protein VKQ52_03155 [Puia sp.]|nr:hypothetical protein [Puia sp.]